MIYFLYKLFSIKSKNKFYVCLILAQMYAEEDAKCRNYLIKLLI